MRKKQSGFTMVEIMIVVAIIGIIIAIAVPGFIRARMVSQARACQENLLKIEGATEQYGLENNLTPAQTISFEALFADDGSGYLKRRPQCPGGGDYSEVLQLNVEPACSIGNIRRIPQISHSIAAAEGTLPDEG